MMRIGSSLLAVAALATLAACGKDAGESYNPITPDLTKARVRVFNATNTTMTFAANGAAPIALDSNLGYGVSRCYAVNPAGPGLKVVNSSTGAEIAGVPTTFDAGKSYVVVAYNPTTTTTNFAFASWLAEGDRTPPADSASLRVFNAAVGAGAVDIYVNDPAVAPATEPALTSMAANSASVPVGGVSQYFNVRSNSSYQYRITRAGVKTTTLINTTNTLLRGEVGTVILGPPSLTSPTTYRASTTQGC